VRGLFEIRCAALSAKKKALSGMEVHIGKTRNDKLSGGINYLDSIAFDDNRRVFDQFAKRSVNHGRAGNYGNFRRLGFDNSIEGKHIQH
jgi:hypothetical protein